MSETITLTKVVIPMNSLSVSVLGNVSAQVNFDFKTKVVALEQIKNEIEAQVPQQDTHTDLINFFKMPPLIINSKTTPTVNAIGVSRTIPNQSPTLIDKLMQTEKTIVHISGNIQLINHKPKPITAVIFAEAHVISQGSNKLTVIDTSRPFLGEMVSQKALNSQIDVLSTNGGQVSINIPTS